MEVNTIIDLLGNYGISFVLMAYFLVKDWKQTESIIAVLSEIRETLAVLKDKEE
ncbi:MAG: hypothetical protein KBS70_05765 [Bacteroidales bacterium]|nr:hypothetical protein [Candidatus Colicola equi]